jgi:hypothetical protein
MHGARWKVYVDVELLRGANIIKQWLEDPKFSYTADYIDVRIRKAAPSA